ncbi:MAG: diphosphomevalonate decarboxylase [Candidatus Aenigmarchaeota archaeon]|nr:diphosphomevalonate decarboxylase [Candidatus Aenigmarchaeota archaeon]
MKATAIANANIALVKYWGKRNKELILPFNSSISMTCDGLHTKTTVDFSGSYGKDTVLINDEELKKDEKNIMAHIERIRQMAGITDKAKIISESNFPVAAGLASSASGLAALTLAASKAAGLNLNEKELTILSRLGSGSASRSIPEGFVEWHHGEKEDGSDSFAESIASKSHWPEFRMLACIVSEARKPVGSRAGMAQTVDNCPYYEGWLKTVNDDIAAVKKGIAERNFTLVGSTAEKNTLKMHALMMTTTPAIIYWIPQTLEIMHSVMLWREEGLESYFTIDGGPQVKVICLQKDEKEILSRLSSLDCVIRAINCPPGGGAQLSNSHLF